MDRVGPAEIQRILAVTDAMGLHRESVVVPLGTRGTGALRLTMGRRLEIIAPEANFDAWVATLRERLEALDLTSLRRVEP